MGRPGRSPSTCSATATRRAPARGSSGPYATGNKTAGIRDYPINKNPLNYGYYGFDSTGNEVHSDGEIWNGTMWEVRQALVDKYAKKYKYSDKALQLACAQAPTDGTSSPFPAHVCPGNRRWVQLMFDSFLLQQGATSMLDARDAFLAADRMRFGGANAKVLSQAFARRGMGKKASTPSADSGDVVPSFASSKGRNVRVKFVAPGRGKVYVGHYEARSTPVADLDKKTKLKDKTQFTPGKYRMVYVSQDDRLQALHPGREGPEGFEGQVPRPSRGSRRGRTTRRPRSGAKVIASTAGSRNPGSLIDGTENTNWGGVTAGSVDATHPSVTVDLAGKRKVRINRIQVSAMLNPAPAEPEIVPLAADPDSGSRFTALRQFALEVCAKKCTSASAKWRRVLRLEGQRVPRHRAASGRARPDPALVQAEAGGQGLGRPAGDAGEPVHRRAGLRRRAGERPDRRHRLQGGVRPRHDRARGRAPGVRQGAQAVASHERQRRRFGG